MLCLETSLIPFHFPGLKRKNLERPVKRAMPMTPEILSKMRDLLDDPKVSLVTWRTVWRAHFEFTLMLRFDDVKRLERKNLIFGTNENGDFITVKLVGN